MTNFTLSDIFIYPVKSLGGFRVEKWEVVNTGLKYDRQWMLIDKQGHFLSQRKLPEMALIHTQITHEHLIISAPLQEDLMLSLTPELGEVMQSTIWGDTCSAHIISTIADAWFSRFLKTPCHLVYLPTQTKRGVDLTYAQDHDRVSFSDGFPFLIASENSLNSLNQGLQTPIEMVRFRPNLVIRGCEAYAEDTWREITIGHIDFRLPKPCSRCAIPGINPQTAQHEKAPLTALSQRRKWQNKTYFGQNALHNQCGELKVGDELTITLSGEKQPPIL
ncbi:MAG: hypothetical protein RL755_804 [Pseudomonadota bacterium]